MKNRPLLILLLLIYLAWLLPGIKTANDLHYVFPEELVGMFSLPSAWGTSGGVGLGEYAVFVLWFWPVSFIFGLLGTLGIKFPQLIVLAGFLPFLLLGFWGISKLLTYLGLTGWGTTIASLFYLINTYILLLIDGGQLNLALAYSVLPLSFVLYRGAIDSGAWKGRLKFALSALALSIFDIRIIYLLILLITLDFVFALLLKPKSISHLSFIINHSKLGFLTGLILFGFHAYWLLPALLAKAPSLPTTYDRPQQVEFLSFANLGHSLYLLQPHWYKNVFGKVIGLRWEFALIPILVFLAPILKPKSRWVAYWLLVALGSVFLVKGANSPLPQIYPWLFSNVPGFSLFRDPTKFFFLTALSYSVLLGVTIDAISRRKFKVTPLHKGVTLGWLIRYLPIFVIVYLLWLVRPVYLGQMTGTFSAPPNQNEYFALAERLQADEEFGRIFWIPTKQPLGYSSPTHPSVEVARLAQKRPFAIGTVGTYETFNFLREAPYMGELFSIAGIKYIVYPFPDTRREELKQDNIDYYNTFLSQLSGLDWTEPISTNSAVPILKTKEHKDRFFVPQNTIFVVGSDDIYTLANRDDFSFANNAMIFVEEQPGLMERIDGFPNAKVLLNGKREVDLAAALLPTNSLIFPAQSLGFSPNEAGWWKREASDLVSWRAFLQQKYGIDNQDFDYGGGYAISEGVNSLAISHQSFTIDGILLARVMESSKGGKIEFYQGNDLVGAIDTRIEEPEEVGVKLTGYAETPDQFFNYDKARFGWHEIGSIIDHQPLIIRTSGDINVVNALAVIPSDEWGVVSDEARRLITERGVRLEEGSEARLSRQEVNVSYERISPTHYKVQVSGLSGPATLAFSENHDGLWEINGSPSIPLYSLINGFSIPGDGEYEVVFSAQKHVLPGLYLSAATLLLVVIGLVVPVRKHRKKSAKIS